jgi:hypothetical protein
MNGMTAAGPVVVAARGQPGVAPAVDLDRVLRERGEPPALIRAMRPEVRFHDHRRAVSGQHPQQFHRGGTELPGPGQVRRRRAESIVQRFLGLVLADEREP